ncbi:MAG: hypothetical protein WAT91_14080 [Saprospiraceae bacterium]
MASAYSQIPSDELVYASVLDTLVKLKDFEFYYSKLRHIETIEYVDNPFDTIVLFDPETYEEVAKTSLDRKIYFDSINLHEAKLFKQRANFKNGLYLISKIKTTHLHKNIILNNYINLDSYPDIKNLTEFSDSIFRYTLLGPYPTLALSDENESNYKYAIKAYLSFSGVLWDKKNKYCLVECGVHNRISDEHSDSGPSGGGFQVILKNENAHLKIIKFIGLWEE